MSKAILKWVARHVVWFIVIAMILMAGEALRREILAFKNETLELSTLSKVRAELDAFGDREAQSIAQRLQAAANEGFAAMEGRVARLDAEILALTREWGATPFRPTDALTPEAAARAKAQLKLELLQQERAYVHEFSQFARAARDIDEAKARLERFRQIHEQAHAALLAKGQQREAFKRDHRLTYWISMTDVGSRWQVLEAEYQSLLGDNLAAHEKYQDQLQAVRRVPEFRKPAAFQRGESALLKELRGLEEGLQKRLKSNWVDKLSKPVVNVLPMAAAIVLGIILAPLLIKALMFYVLAPLASRRPAICLLPQAHGMLNGGNSPTTSAVSHVIHIDPGHELLVHSEYLQSTPDLGAKDTRWLLNYSIPLSSLASGMVALTRIRSEEVASVVVSATKDPLGEIGLITLPEGGAVVLQPRSLVGIVQPIDRPMRITRHWKLGTLSAWLTFQWRYLVFHGPATLIVKGCRGIRVEPAEGGRNINQAATIGFSANVAYSVRRLETFMPYLAGKQELFNDNFAGGPGYYIYEEVPDAGRMGGVTGRGLEGVFDSLLKVFGI